MRLERHWSQTGGEPLAAMASRTGTAATMLHGIR